MTQEGETEGYTVGDHIGALLFHGANGMMDICLANSAPVSPGVMKRYLAEDAAPVVPDRERVEALGVELVERPLASEGTEYARHSSDRLARAVMELYRERAHTRVF